MDDFIVLHESKEYLRFCLETIKDKLHEYKLVINKKKTRIDSIKNGIDFLGYRFYCSGKIIIRIGKRCKKNFKKKVKNLKLLKCNNYINEKMYYNLISSYKGILKYCSWVYKGEVC